MQVGRGGHGGRQEVFAGQEPASSPISIIGEGREGSPASPGEGEAGKKKFKWNIKVGRGDVGHPSEDMRVQQGLQISVSSLSSSLSWSSLDERETEAWSWSCWL